MSSDYDVTCCSSCSCDTCSTGSIPCSCSDCCQDSADDSYVGTTTDSGTLVWIDDDAEGWSDQVYSMQDEFCPSSMEETCNTIVDGSSSNVSFLEAQSNEKPVDFDGTIDGLPIWTSTPLGTPQVLRREDSHSTTSAESIHIEGFTQDLKEDFDHLMTAAKERPQATAPNAKPTKKLRPHSIKEAAQLVIQYDSDGEGFSPMLCCLRRR